MAISYIVATCVRSIGRNFGRKSKAKSNTEKKKCARSKHIHCLETTTVKKNKRFLFGIETALKFSSM